MNGEAYRILTVCRILLIVAASISVCKGADHEFAQPLKHDNWRRSCQDYAQFGAVVEGEWHTGMDYSGQPLHGPQGPPVYSSSSGYIVLMQVNNGNDHGWGNTLIVKNDRKYNGKATYSQYSHLYEFAEAAEACRNQGTKQARGRFHCHVRVEQGIELGTMGGTYNGGNNPEDVHLHYEIKMDPSLGPFYGYDKKAPDSLGFLDPIEFFYTKTQYSSPRTATVTPQGAGAAPQDSAVMLRGGPGKRYVAIRQVTHGERFEAVAKVSPTDESCDQGWYQVRPSVPDGVFRFDKDVAPGCSSGSEVAIEDAWICAGNQDESWLAVSEQESAASTATALIIDRSASMIGYVTGKQGKLSEDPRDRQKLKNAKHAAKAFITALNKGDMVSVSSFSDSADTQVPMKELGESRRAIDKKIDRISAGNSTNFPEGLTEGFQQLKGATEASSKMAILLSDGENTAGSWRPIVEQFKAEEWPICTVGFGSRADEATLKQIAEDTKCLYQYAETNNIVNKYQELSAYANNNSVVLSATDLLPPEGKVSYPFEISPGTESFSIFSSWQGSELAMNLTTPGGSSVTPKENNALGTRYSGGDTFQVLKVLSSQSGRWRVDVDWEEPPEFAEQIHISVAEQSDIYVRMHGFRPTYEAGEAVRVSVQAAEVIDSTKVPLQQGKVEVEVLKPDRELAEVAKAGNKDWTMYRDVVKMNTSTLSLRDDGAHDDYEAGDGVFSNVFRETGSNGTYVVKARVRGKNSNGDLVNKVVHGYFQVGDIRKNAVTSSAKLNLLSEAKRQTRAVDERTPYSEETMSDPGEAIEKLQSEDPADEIDKLLQQ